MGQLPSRLGYQPTLGTELAELQDRICNTRNAAITAVQAASLESQLRFSRQNEQEADRLGMATMVTALAWAGYVLVLQYRNLDRRF